MPLRSQLTAIKFESFVYRALPDSLSSGRPFQSLQNFSCHSISTPPVLVMPAAPKTKGTKRKRASSEENSPTKKDIQESHATETPNSFGEYNDANYERLLHFDASYEYQLTLVREIETGDLYMRKSEWPDSQEPFPHVKYENGVAWSGLLRH